MRPRELIFRGSLILLLLAAISPVFASPESGVRESFFFFGAIGFFISVLVKVFSGDYKPKSDKES